MRHPICCQDLATMLRIRYVVEESQLGYCFRTATDKGLRLVPFHFCPWCKAELSTPGERSPIIGSYVGGHTYQQKPLA